MKSPETSIRPQPDQPTEILDSANSSEQPKQIRTEYENPGLSLEEFADKYPDLEMMQKRHLKQLRQEQNQPGTKQKIRRPTLIQRDVDPETGERIDIIFYGDDDPIIIRESDEVNLQPPEEIPEYRNLCKVLDAESIIVRAHVEDDWMEEFENNPDATLDRLQKIDQQNKGKYELLRQATARDLGIDLPRYELLPLSITASDEIDKAIRIKLKIFEPSNAKKRSTQTVNPEEEKLLGLKLRIMAKLELASVIKEKISDFIKGLELDKKVAAKKSAQEQAN